ncbi:MAG: hypothetical protein ACI4GB_06935 [Acutalibacteraceae bacterium]
MTNSKIVEILKKNNFKLLGQIEVSAEEYNKLIEFISVKVKNINISSMPSADLVLSLALVQIAIRKYQDGRFWPCFEEELGYNNIPSSHLNYIGRIFFKTIKQYDLFMPRIDDGNFQYVEYIKAHAFVTNYYMQGFYDFSYAYYENNLFRQLNSESIEEDFEDLSSFMETTLKNKNDNIIETGSNRAAKSYKLLKSTRTTFAICDTNTIRKIFLPILKLIDNYFYDNEIPQICKNRYEEAFIEWCRIQDAKNNQKNEKHTRTRKEFSHKPYISVDVDKEFSHIVIPPQKFRDEDCEGYAKAIIEINGYTETIELDVYKSFGLYITEEKHIPIPSIFDSVDITIKTLSKKHYRIPASNYRIFDRQWKYRNRFDIGYNYILVCHGVPTKWENSQDEIDSYDGYRNWNYFSAKINEESIFYVGNKPISIIGEFSAEPIFERRIEHFSAFDKAGNEIAVSREHPAVSFVVEKEKFNGSVLTVNNIKYSVETIKEKICYDWPEDKRKLAVSVPLNVILPMEDKQYDVLLDVPGEVNKKLCSYLLVRKFDCRFNKPRYTYDATAMLKITKGDCLFDITDESWEVESESEKSITYTIPLDMSSEKAELILYLYDEYKITMPIRVFKYGFSEISMKSQRDEFIWYTELKETLYVKLPGAKSVSAYYGKLDMFMFEGTLIAPDTFRIDISEFVRKINEDSKITYHYITLEYEDNAKRRLGLPVIYRQTVIKPYFKLFLDGEEPYIDVDIKGNSNVFVEIKTLSGDMVVAKKPIANGKNSFPELSKDEYYNFLPFIEEGGKFAFNTTREYMQPLSNVGCIDLDNLEKCELILKTLSAEENILPLNYEYHLNLIKKEDDITYIGSLIGFKIERHSKNGRARYEKDSEGKAVRKKLGKVHAFVTRIEDELNVSLQVFSYDDEDWYSMYYDKNTKSLVHIDDPVLSSKEIDRFIELDEFSANTTFDIDISRIRKHKEW